MNRALAGLALTLGIVAASPAVAGAAPDGYGELTRFGESGSGAGQINGEEHRSTEEQRSRLIGVDPSNNGVFVLDEPRDYEQARKKPTREEEEECVELEVPLDECGVPTGPVKRHFRLQKFSLSGGRYQPAGSVQFEAEAPNGTQGPTRMGAEGIAVDPARKRVYVLGVDARAQKAKVDVEARNGPGRTGNLPVASTLFAFTTELVPAGKAGKNKEILTGPGAGELEAQSEAPGRALLEPGGIAVDPETGDVIVVAHEDPSGASVDQVFDSKEGASPDHYVLQRIHAGGEVVGGAAGRYVDIGNFFKQTDFLEFKPPAPNSPIVVGGAGEEQVFLVYERGLAAVPADFSTKAPPAYRYRPLEQFAAAEGRIALTQNGGALSAAPAGAQGSVIYAPTVVENEQPKVGGALKGVMALAGTGPTMAGWVGGQSLLAPRGAGEERDECVIEPGSEEMFAAVAAGSEEKVFVLANEFVAEVEGERTYPGPPFPAVVEFGPGGGGCPKAVPRGLEGEVNGELLGERSIAPGEAVTFSSYVRQADAVEVEWDFGDGTRETVTGQFQCRKGVVPEEDSLYEANVRQCPTARHTFTSGGALTVTETIHTDDLATPVVTQETIVHVIGEALGPTAVATGPLQAIRGQEARFDGSASFDPGGPNQITEYHWSFGDGQSQTSSSPIASHVYQQVGFYPVSLTVTDASGRTSPAATLPLPVAVVEPPPPREPIQTETQTGTGAPVPAAASSSSSSAPPASKTGSHVTLTTAALRAGSKGELPVLLYCSAGDSTCQGTVTLRATLAVLAHRGKRSKAAPVTLARAPFTIPGGVRRRVLLRLRADARVALARSRKLLGQLQIVAHDAAGATRATRVPVVISTAGRPHRARRR